MSKDWSSTGISGGAVDFVGIVGLESHEEVDLDSDLFNSFCCREDGRDCWRLL